MKLYLFICFADFRVGFFNFLIADYIRLCISLVVDLFLLAVNFLTSLAVPRQISLSVLISGSLRMGHLTRLLA